MFSPRALFEKKKSIKFIASTCKSSIEQHVECGSFQIIPLLQNVVFVRLTPHLLACNLFLFIRALIPLYIFSTWFFIAANPVLTFFVVWLAFRYGHLKLGDKNAKPEFSDVSYFAMIFSAGIGVGLFFFGVSEPLWHQSSHYYSNPGYRSQDEVDQWALLITMYHWGFAAWSPCTCTLNAYIMQYFSVIVMLTHCHRLSLPRCVFSIYFYICRPYCGHRSWTCHV